MRGRGGECRCTAGGGRCTASPATPAVRIPARSPLGRRGQATLSTACADKGAERMAWNACLRVLGCLRIRHALAGTGSTGVPARRALPVRRRGTLAGGWGRPRLAWAHPTGGRRRCRSAGARDHGERAPAWLHVGLARGRLVRRGATRHKPCRRRDASCLPAAAVAAPAGAMALVGLVARLYLARDDLASPGISARSCAGQPCPNGCRSRPVEPLDASFCESCLFAP